MAPLVERVTRRRLDYLTSLFRELGFDAVDARRRALLAYTAYLGHAQVAHATRRWSRDPPTSRTTPTP